MPVDVWATLRPQAGLARRVCTSRPDGDTNLLWSILVELGDRDRDRDEADRFRLDHVGASGVQRADAFTRAAGEAVERSALKPGAALPDDPAAAVIDPGLLWRDTAGLPASGWCVAQRLADAERRRVPVGVVDYPARRATTTFDPTPSGAAAGPTYEAAVCGALRELVEREVALVAWARHAAVPRIDLERSLRGAAPAEQLLDQLRGVAAAKRIDLVAALIPTGVEGADAVMAWAFDRAHRLASAGLAVCERTQDAVIKALQECLQMRCVLLGAKRHAGRGGAPVRDDVSRAMWWTTAPAWEAATRWAACLGTAVEVPAAGARSECDDSEAATVAGIERWRRRVPDALVVDLRARITPPLRGLGWHAVKVMSPTTQPLVMDDAAQWRWSKDRLALPERSWSVDCGSPIDIDEIVPHPFV